MVVYQWLCAIHCYTVYYCSVCNMQFPPKQDLCLFFLHTSCLLSPMTTFLGVAALLSWQVSPSGTSGRPNLSATKAEGIWPRYQFFLLPEKNTRFNATGERRWMPIGLPPKWFGRKGFLGECDEVTHPVPMPTMTRISVYLFSMRVFVAANILQLNSILMMISWTSNFF